MPIQLTKTIRGDEYNLYITTLVTNPTRIVDTLLVNLEFYKSKDHFDDGFTPIIKRKLSISNKQVVNLFRTNYAVNNEAAIYSVEFFISRLPFYNGSSVVDSFTA